MYYDFGAQRGKRSGINIKITPDFLVSRKVGIPKASLKKIQCDCGLWKQSIPEMHGKLAVCETQPGNKIIFEGLNRSFGYILAMGLRWHQLELYVLFLGTP